MASESRREEEPRRDTFSGVVDAELFAVETTVAAGVEDALAAGAALA